MRTILLSFGLMVICLFVTSLSFGLDPATVATGHVYLLDNISGTEVPDDSANDNIGTTNGEPAVVPGLSGNALKLDGVDDYVAIPNTEFINAGGPWPNRTVIAKFNCADVSKLDDTGAPAKQCIYEEGGATRGFVIYVFDGQVYVGGWNRDATQVDWNPGSWISAPIGSNEWHAVAFVLREGGTAEVEPDKFEMWLDGDLVGKAEGSQIYGHTAGVGIGAVNGDTVFHDEVGPSTTLGFFYEGIVDEVWILNDALSGADLGAIATSVEPADRLTSTWGAMKALR
jgi:hypothetical protein